MRILTIAFMSLCVLVGCETIEGAGQDIENAGDTIEDAANDAK